MIGSLRGTLLEKHPQHALIDVGGVGYKVYVTLTALGSYSEGDSLTLYTHLHVREQALDLYGFANTEEQFFFELLLSVSGIGPKSALTILNVAPPNVLRQAVSSGDTSHLVKVSGVGAKSAQKIILELKDKLGKIDEASFTFVQDDLDVAEALMALGYSQKDVREVLQKLPNDLTETNDKIKEALKLLG